MRTLHLVPLLIALSTLAAAAAVVAASATASPEPPPGSVLAELPFERPGEPSRIYVDLAPEGSDRPFVWLLDTGASFSVLTPLAARAMGVSVRRDKSDAYRRGTRLGRDIQFVIDTQSSDTGGRTGWEYGLLGSNFLEQYVLELDFEARRVRLLDPERFEVPERADAPHEAVIPMRLASRRPSVEIEMNGRKIYALLDTGAPGTAILSGAAARKLGVDVGALPAFGELGTVMGPMKVKLYETERFRFAGFDFDAMPLLVAPRGWYNQGGSSDSVIGYDTISQFTVRIDYPRRRIWLRRNHTEVTYLGVPYELTRRSGLFLDATGSAYGVIGFLPDSPAARYGLRPGDFLGAALAPNQTIQTILRRLVDGKKITVTRLENDIIDEVTLPVDHADSPAAAEERAAQEAVTASRDQSQLDEWKKRQAERLFAREKEGGWIVIEGYRRRAGPKEGEVWVTFEEMQRIKRQEAEGGG